jgi:thiol-disulfide isomerase/thioredoxin
MQRRELLRSAAGCLWLPLAAQARAAQPETLTARPWPARLATPALTLPGWDGAPWRLESARGKPVLLNFWASWCEPCRAEMPALELLAARHEAQGLLVMAVNFRETDAALRRFLEASATSLPILRDSDGAAAKAFGVRTFPSTVAISRQGRALSTLVGEIDWSSPPARRWVAALL